MKKTILAAVLLLCGCSCLCPNTPARVISNEKGTNIYYNNEFIGSDSTYAVLRNKNADNSFLQGQKKGCTPKTLAVEYRFDLGVFNLFDLRNWVRLLTWDVYIVDGNKDLYNVTPDC